MDVISSLWALIRESFATYSIVASFGNATVEYIDEELLEDLREKNSVSPVGLLTLLSGFFGIVISAGILAYAGLTQNVTQLAIADNLKYQALLAGALEAWWMVPYLHATNRIGTLKAAPLFQAIPIFSFIFGYFCFEESFETQHIIACIVIMSGALILSVNKDTFEVDKRAVGQMMVASLTIAFVYSFFKDIANESNFLGALFWSGIGMFAMSVVMWCVRQPYREELRAFLKSPSEKLLHLQLINESVNAVSVVASHYAVLKAPTAMAATALNAFHPIFILVFGWIKSKRGSKKHLDALSGGEGLKNVIAILIIIAGTALIAL